MSVRSWVLYNSWAVSMDEICDELWNNILEIVCKSGTVGIHDYMLWKTRLILYCKSTTTQLSERAFEKQRTYPCNHQFQGEAMEHSWRMFTWISRYRYS
ncbi:hypothetical protein JHK85_010379 [Glycine max]|nr:hypothetical protein JHK85_010379 [Glycine max]